MGSRHAAAGGWGGREEEGDDCPRTSTKNYSAYQSEKKLRWEGCAVGREGSLGEQRDTKEARNAPQAHTHLGKSCHVFLPAEGRRLFILPSVYCG